jgi:hypothetical protein
MLVQMNTNKSLMIGFGIFIALIIGLFSIGLTMNVNAQSILNNNTNISISNIYYILNLSELNLSNSNSLTYDVSTNITTLINLSVALDYDCIFSINNISRYLSNSTFNPANFNEINQTLIGTMEGNVYNYLGSTNNLTDLIFVNQTIAENLETGLYIETLKCLYNINTTNNTLRILGALINGVIDNNTNIIFNETTLLLDQLSLNNNKFLIIDNSSANIILNNQVNNLSNYSNNPTIINQTLIIDTFTYDSNISNTNFLLNFSITDLSLMNCSAFITSTKYNYSGNFIFDYYSNYSYNYLSHLAPLNSTILVPINISNNVSNSLANTTTRFDYVIKCFDLMNNVNTLNS